MRNGKPFECSGKRRVPWFGKRTVRVEGFPRSFQLSERKAQAGLGYRVHPGTDRRLSGVQKHRHEKSWGIQMNITSSNGKNEKGKTKSQQPNLGLKGYVGGRFPQGIARPHFPLRSTLTESPTNNEAPLPGWVQKKLLRAIENTENPRNLNN